MVDSPRVGSCYGWRKIRSLVLHAVASGNRLPVSSDRVKL